VRWTVAAFSVGVLVVACGGASATPATTTGLASSTSATAAPTSRSAATSSSVIATSTTAAPTTTATSRTTTTTTSSSTTTTTEPARRRPAGELAAPDGFARHEPGPAWEGEAALTGLDVDPAVRTRPALAVKIDNAPGGRPPWNLADADLVFEENVEGITRFIAVFHSTTPDRIGPVRSARLSDLDVLAGLNRPVLAWSGGNPGVTSYVRAGHRYGWLSNLSAQSTSCFWRSGTRGAPHNLLLDPICAWESATHAGPARPVFARDDGGTPAGRPEREFGVRMDGVSIGWVWDPATGRYLRRQSGDWHVDVDGDPVAATNVVVLAVDYVPSVVDERSPQAVTVGSGRAVVHRGGVSITGTWSRTDRFDPFTLTSDDGRPMALAPGTVFVELTR
jgi:hypothetical protein